eukprot:Skav236791  [mRNA]  locus=scaffold1361:385896:386304:- [translate_table: standard]
MPRFLSHSSDIPVSAISAAQAAQADKKPAESEADLGGQEARHGPSAKDTVLPSASAIQMHQAQQDCNFQAASTAVQESLQAAAGKIQAIYRGRMAREQACVCLPRLAYGLK